MTDDTLLDPFVKMLADISTPAAVRMAEREGDVAAAWPALCESGFLDALVPEERGGVGLGPDILGGLAIACGEHLVAAPVAETIVARAILARRGVDSLPQGPILLWPQTAEGHLRSLVAPVFCAGAQALVHSGDELDLATVEADARDGFGLIPAALGHERAGLLLDGREANLTYWSAAIASAYMAGAMNRIVALTIDHANTRVQFGRPLAKLQAIQHHLAVMAERAAVANAAAAYAFVTDAPALNPWRVAVAKSVVSEGAGEVCALAHAVHGAIGVSEEHDLQLYTRRIKRWQLSFGAASYWAREAGRPWREPGTGTSIDRIRHLAAD